MTRFTLLLFVAACHASPRPTPVVSPLDRANAYVASQASESCRIYIIEPRHGDDVIIDVREKHGGVCAGDPGVAPLVERLRLRSSAPLERYDVATDSWTSVRS